MATLGTQNISTSYPQLLKVSGNTPFTSTLLAIATGDESSVSALQISTLGVSSSGTLNSVGATTLASSLAVTGAATFSSSLGVAGVATLSSSLGVTGVATFSSSISATTGTATIGTATISTATISTATIPTILGAVTFGSNITASTGTATIGTESVNVSTIGTLGVTNTATVGTLKVGASGPSLTAAVFATAAYTGGTVLDIDHATTGSNVSTGTLAASGVVLGDMVIGNINSIGSATGVTPAGLLQDFRVESAGVLRFTIFNSTQTTGTIPSGTISATAMRFTA